MSVAAWLRREAGAPIPAEDELRPVLRWLLRPFGDPSFALRTLYPDTIGFERLFRQIPADPPDEAESRVVALEVLAQLPNQPAADQQAHLLRMLWSLPEPAPRHLHELARDQSLRALFRYPVAAVSAEGYVETHVHFRGAVPFEFLWNRWVKQPRWRGLLGHPRFEVPDPFRLLNKPVTWADMIERALNGFGAPRLEQAIEYTRQHPADPRYLPLLTVAAALRADLMHPRRSAGRRQPGHEPRSPGLATFVQSYDRYAATQKTPVKADEPALIRAALHPFAWEQVEAIELRPTLDATADAIRAKLRSFLKAWWPPSSDRPALVLLPSLFKQDLKPDRPTSPDEERDIWRDQQDHWIKQTEALLTILEDDPLLRAHVVGIDAAGEEQGCPPRVFLPVVERLRAYNQRHGLTHQAIGPLIHHAALPGTWEESWEAALRTETPFHRLGLTLHAGEDFTDPLTGLRHIGEALTLLDMQPGERLGHALAAGLDNDHLESLLRRRAAHGGALINRGTEASPRYFAQKPRGTHLLDLAWLHDQLPNRAELGPMLLNTLQHALQGDGESARLARDLMRPGARPALGLSGVRFWRLDQLDPREVEWVALDAGWRERFEEARREVLAEIERREIVIESCPSSNLAVADLAQPVTATFLAKQQLRVVVATDDPGLFGAWPAEELARFPNERDRLVRASRQAAFVRWAPAQEEP
jgi:adenosine deaminase